MAGGEPALTPLFEISPEANDDLIEIWRHIATDSVDLAERIEDELQELFAKLGANPYLGHARPDLTRQPVLFFPLYSFLVVYQPEARPIRIMAVLRAKRNLARILRTRR